MPRVIRRISTIVYGLGIVAALSFGASQALGRAVYLTCRYNPPTELGACLVNDGEECTQRCQTVDQDTEAIGRCLGGCCICFL